MSASAVTPTRVTAAHVAQLRHVTLRLSRRLRKQAGPGLTPSQQSALSTLERHRDMPIGELARREQISKSSVTRLVARLEELGHLERYVDPTDRRVTMVRLTPHGESLLAEASRRQNDYLARQIRSLDATDQASILGALPALVRLLEIRTP
jgi:DNA-binding MarR family transcriptional regulator